MHIVNTRTIEDCLDGSTKLEVQLDQPVTEHVIMTLGEHGELEYHPDFPRPYYKIVIPNTFTINGINNTDTLRIVVHPNTDNDPITFLETHLPPDPEP